MRPRTLAATAALIALAGTGCGGSQTSYVHSETVLGRVVIYRNGVAYFERSATVTEDNLRLSVPAERVDDFLRSLTVVDADTGQPAPVSYPTAGALQGGSGLIDMKIGLSGPAPHRLKLSYVTESPSWKPSYRLVLDKPGKVDVQGWAVVDNTSGENWKSVKLGVGSSSAMSFRYDLHTLRTVQRETLRSNDLFAQAPPTGGATYGQAGGTAPVLAELSDSTLANEMVADSARNNAPAPVALSAPAPPSGFGGKAAAPGMAQAQKAARLGTRRGGGAAAPVAGMAEMDRDDLPSAPPPPPPPPASSKISEMARRLLGTHDQIVIEGFADRGDADKNAASLARASRVREQLIRDGLPPDRVVAIGRGDQPGHAGGIRVVQAPPPAASAGAKPGARGGNAAAMPQDPIGTAHFESESAMTVPGGSSAMVSIMKAEADGEVVYLFDPDSPHGDESFPFKAIRLRNPTDSVLESGPVTVFAGGRFIGEGLVEPIPAR